MRLFADITDWLTRSLSQPSIDLDALVTRLAIAAVVGAGVGVIYYLTQRRGAVTQVSFLSTLVLLCILIAMVTQVVGDNAARAFSLVGTLAIVRFRTVVEDTRDTAFVILSVAVGMAIGAGFLGPALVCLGIVGFAASMLRCLPDVGAEKAEEDWSLQIRIGLGFGDPPPWDELFQRHLHDVRLVGTASARQGAAFDLTYKVRLKSEATPLAFLKEMNRLEGIQNLELRRVGPVT